MRSRSSTWPSSSSTSACGTRTGAMPPPSTDRSIRSSMNDRSSALHTGSRLMLRLGLPALVITTLLLAACATLNPSPAVPISEVVSLSKAGAPPEQVIARIGRTVYAPRGSDFGKLAELGVQPPVLDFIQTRFVNDVELLTRTYVQGDSRG